MSYNDSSQRSRGPSGGPSEVKPSPNLRPAQEIRNGGPSNPGLPMTRAEKFDDEKRRIIQTCFGKKDADGSICESYITHIRVVEDATYPSSPPPAESSSDTKKHRVIIIAVRKSGRVMMHKARQNDSGSFSIGKSWFLEDLTAVESYANSNPSTAEEQQNKERAGSLGFLIIIQRPYYWQATTIKEKEFFIFSLIKNFKKYTGGKLPKLQGFDPQELEQLVGQGLSSDARSNKPPSQPNREDRRGPSQGTYVQGDRSPNRQQSDRPLQNGREPRPQPYEEHSSRERLLPTRSHPGSWQQTRPSQESTAADSSESIPQIPGSFPSSEFVRRLRPKNSQPELKTKESESSIKQARDGDSLGNPMAQQQPGLRKLAAAQSSESFRKRVEQQSSKTSTSEEADGERTQLHTTSSLMSPLDTPKQPSPERFEIKTVPTPLRTGVLDDWSSFEVQQSEPKSSRADSRPSSSQRTANSEVSQERTMLTPWQGHRDDLSRKSSDLSSRSNRQDEPSQLEPSKPLDNTNISGTSLTPTANGEDQTKNSHTAINPSSYSPAIAEENTRAVEPPPTTPTELPKASTPDEESHRPGLGPMIKKRSNKEIANSMLKAATAYSAFKPRAGGAAERLLNSEKRATDEHDGVTGVFPASSVANVSRSVAAETPKDEGNTKAQTLAPAHPNELPLLQTMTAPAEPSEIINPVPSAHAMSPPELPAAPNLLREERRRRRRSDYSSKYAKSLGINHSLLEGRTFEFDTVLNELGWIEETTHKNTFEDIQSRLRKEIARLEAGTWLGVLENGDERVSAVNKMMDKVITECEELDCLLTLYNAELGTLSEDVAYIEAQSQGLQVQTANQKILHTELKSLLDTISISASELQVLKEASLSQTEGIKAIEDTLAQLFTAMLMIDPQLHHNGSRPDTTDGNSVDAGNVGGLGGSTLSSMHAVREKKDGYRREGREFVHRFKQYMSIKFRGSEVEIISELERRKRSSKPWEMTRLDFRLRDEPKAGLWIYSPLILFARETEPQEWDYLMRMYENTAKKPYQHEIQDHIASWKSITRKPWGEEDFLFTTMQEKETESIVGRKLTVKRTKTVRSDGTSRISTGGKPKDGKVNAYEAFAGALSETAQLITIEQNFVVGYFHLSSLENSDFLDAIATTPEARRGGNLMEKKSFDPDRKIAKRVFGMMEEVFSFWPAEIQSLVDWVVEQETLQGVGLLLSLESQLFELEETNQEFLLQTLNKIHDRLAALFGRFVDEQMRGIEETKVKIKKRKGVISFMKTFPDFSVAVESMLPHIPSFENPPIRSMVNEAYQKLNKAMFESLKFIAKESPLPGAHGQSSTTGSGDPEDKEALNYHILLIENMHHYVEEVHPRTNPVLEEWKACAAKEMSEHMNLYLSAVIRRPLGKLLDFLESTESLLLLLPPVSSAPSGAAAAAAIAGGGAGGGAAGASTNTPSSIATRTSHSRSTFKKLLGAHDVRELRRGIDALRKRVEKHFGDADEAELSRALVAKVLKQCEVAYVGVRERLGRVITEVYEDRLEMDWRIEDVIVAFRR